jgi:magnesium-transporting ATPase (P-type)
MGFGNIVIILLLMYYTFYFISLTSSKKRKGIQQKNKKLDSIRSVPVKTLGEQKEFLDLKYPVKPKFTMTWKKFFLTIAYIAFITSTFMFYSSLLKVLKIDVPLYLAIIIIIVVPIIFNYILSKFSLEKDDLLIFFGGTKKKSKR